MTQFLPPMIAAQVAAWCRAQSSGSVTSGERVRQDAQPPGGQRLDLLRVQAVAGRLHRGHVVDGGEGIVQRHETDAGLGGLPLGVLVALMISRPV
jgi:hypothetical protein